MVNEVGFLTERLHLHRDTNIPGTTDMKMVRFIQRNIILLSESTMHVILIYKKIALLICNHLYAHFFQ